MVVGDSTRAPLLARVADLDAFYWPLIFQPVRIFTILGALRKLTRSGRDVARLVTGITFNVNKSDEMRETYVPSDSRALSSVSFYSFDIQC